MLQLQADVGAYFEGDTFGEGFSADVVDDGAVVDLTGVPTPQGTLLAPDGTTSALDVTVSDAAQGQLQLAPVAPVTLDQHGIWLASIQVAAGGDTLQAEPARFVVQDPAWLTLQQARSDWRDAPSSDVQLWRILASCAGQVLSVGRKAEVQAIRDGAPVPDNYLQAQLMQARNTWNAAKMDPSAQIGAEPGFAFAPFPMDWQVRQLIRPKLGRPNPR